VHPFELVANPVRRRILEVLTVGDHDAGTLSEIASMEFGTSRTSDVGLASPPDTSRARCRLVFGRIG
jgi:hypothetical protein